MTRPSMSFTVLLAVLFNAGVPSAHAQLTAEIDGTISDSSGAVIPNAKITVINENTGIKWESVSSQAGQYTVPLLQPGTYKINVQSEGFRAISRTGIHLEVAQTAKVDFKMEVGAVTDSIEVTGTAALLDAGTNAIGGLVSAEKVENLPLKGRNSNAFMMLVPGVRTTRATTGGPVLESHYQFFSVNGSRPNQNQFQLDGGNNTDLAFNSPDYSAQVDAVEEIKVQTNNFSAEYANAGGAVINIVTKGGTNTFHGSLFEFLRNDALAANNFFSNSEGSSKPALRYNQFGGTVGGPIIKNRTFFFFGYEGVRFKNPVTRTTSVPTALQRTGDFSQTLASNGRMILVADPLTTRQDPANPANYLRTPFAGNVIPRNRISSVSENIEKYYPAPTSAGNPFTGLNNFFFQGSQTQPVNDISIRMDHQLNSRTLMTARYSESRITITVPGTFGEENIATPSYTLTNEYHPSGLFKVMETFTPTMFGEFVASWNRFWFKRVGLSNGFDPTQIGLPSYVAANSKSLGFPSISPGEMSGLGSYAAAHDIGDRGEIKANLSKVFGKHTLKFGGLYDMGRYVASLHNNAVGTYSFTKGFTQGPDPLQASAQSGFGYASFLLGALAGGTQNGTDLDSNVSQSWIGFYVQDDYKITPRLTVNLGIRYDYEIPRTEVQNRASNFDYSGTATLPNGTAVRGGLVFPGVGGVPRGNWNKDPNNFGPRIGFAYSLGQSTVLRGGYGVFFANSWGSGRNGGFLAQTGFTCSTAVNSSLDGGLTPFAYISDPFQSGFCKPSGSSAGLATNLGQAVGFVDRDQRVPYGESWNFDIQRKLPAEVVVELAYSGSRGINLIGQLEYNQLAPQYMSLGTRLNSQVANPFYGVITSGPLAEKTITLGQSLRPYPQFLGVTSNNATYGASTYHAMFLRVERRLSKGFSVLASYTVSKLIDDLIPSPTGFPGESFSGAPLQNFYDRRGERALASWDTPQTLVLSYVYELPFGQGKALLNHGGVLGKIVGGWQLNGITMFQSGPPLQITGGNSNGAFAGTQRPNWSGSNATLSGPISQRLGAYFDTSAFTINAPYTFGNAPRLMPNLRGPGSNNFDISLFKAIEITEKVRAQFRAEAFNAFNRVQFGIPNTGITSNLFGRISSQQNSPRDIQLALKLMF